jgi:hypothetical protein
VWSAFSSIDRPTPVVRALIRHVANAAATTLVVSSAATAQVGSAPRPEPAVDAVFAAFGEHPVVALGMSHQQQDEADFSLRVIRDPRFATIVNDIVVECGNPNYQPVLDQYIAGHAVQIEQLQLVWRNTTQPGRCDPRQHRELLDAVREVNRQLHPSRRIRVLAGDSPIDWAKIRRPEDMRPFLTRRDSDFAGVVEREVLSRHRKALLVIGAAHVLHHPITWRNDPTPPAPTVTMILEATHPHAVFVIMPHDGYGTRRSEFEARLAGWTKPSLVRLHGTWLGDVHGKVVFGANIRRVGAETADADPYYGFNLQDLADGYLYLGPLATLAPVQWPDFTGTAYANEIQRRNQLMGMRTAPAPVPR